MSIAWENECVHSIIDYFETLSVKNPCRSGTVAHSTGTCWYSPINRHLLCKQLQEPMHIRHMQSAGLTNMVLGVMTGENRQQIDMRARLYNYGGKMRDAAAPLLLPSPVHAVQHMHSRTAYNAKN